MKESAFIICEYDPFHNGHLYHIRQTRRAGAKNVICIMSGNFLQRGTIALCDKTARSRYAIDHGADLILELPVKYVLSGAPYFAKGAVEAIRYTGINGTLSFGGSCGIDALMRLVRFTADEKAREKINRISLACGANHAAAVYRAAKEDAPEIADLLLDPNNVLAAEYIKAASRFAPDLDYYCVKRNVRHDSLGSESNICSAKKIRGCYYNSGSFEAVKPFLPEDVYADLQQSAEARSLISTERYSAAFTARLIGVSKEDLLAVNGINQGLENRIADCIRRQSDLFSLFDSIKTKRFTHARIRQAILSACLGIKKPALERPQPYLRVLGCNRNGRTLINQIRETCSVPVIMNLSEAPACEERELDALCGKMYDICRIQPQTSNSAFSAKPYVSG